MHACEPCCRLTSFLRQSAQRTTPISARQFFGIFLNELDVAELNELDSLEEDEEHGGGLTPAGLADPLLLMNFRL